MFTGVFSSLYSACTLAPQLLECLREEFPALTKLLGEDTFNSFAITYLDEFPPRSYTLNHLGTRFPEFLRESRPPRESDSGEPDWADLMIDLGDLTGDEKYTDAANRTLDGLSGFMWQSAGQADHLLIAAATSGVHYKMRLRQTKSVLLPIREAIATQQFSTISVRSR